jgi:uncharacterized membrane protein YphA (DoxX/SURF4 family)
MNAPGNAATVWPPHKRLIFRFVFLYFVLYCFPFPLDAFQFLDPVASPYYNLLDRLILLVGKKWFHLTAHVAFPTFDKVDDSFYGLVFIYFILILSALGTVIWSVVDRKAKKHERLFQLLKLYLRYFLASYLFGYGFVKVFPSQFQAITASRLTMTVGDQSPMLLAWNFMGHSIIMQRLNGLLEVIAGLLLLFRRTTTLGAILSTAVFSFVVMMDFSFNVPVRLLSSHLLLISVLLVLADGRRLMNVFVLNRPASAAVYSPLINHPVGRKVFTASLAVLAFCLLYSTITKGLDAERSFGQTAPHGPLYGVYHTDYFLRNKDTIPPSKTDSLRWKQLVIDGPAWNQFSAIKFNNDNRISYTINTDTAKRTINIKSLTDTTEKYSFNYMIPDSTHIILKGRWNHDSLEVLMTKYNLNHYLLHREKFKWITD